MMDNAFEDLFNQAYYLNTKMIKFLLVENLTLKMLLNDSGLLDPKKFEEVKKTASEILELKSKAQFEEYKKSNPQTMLAFFETQKQKS